MHGHVEFASQAAGLLPLAPMGCPFSFEKGEGPVLHKPIVKASDVDDDEPWWCEFATDANRRGAQAYATTAPLAVCRAALAALEER